MRTSLVPSRTQRKRLQLQNWLQKMTWQAVQVSQEEAPEAEGNDTGATEERPMQEDVTMATAEAVANN